jgi:hypothetical protein
MHLSRFNAVTAETGCCVEHLPSTPAPRNRKANLRHASQEVEAMNRAEGQQAAEAQDGGNHRSSAL